MKKLLSIVVMVLLGVTSGFADSHYLDNEYVPWTLGGIYNANLNIKATLTTHSTGAGDVTLNDESDNNQEIHESLHLSVFGDRVVKGGGTYITTYGGPPSGSNFTVGYTHLLGSRPYAPYLTAQPSPGSYFAGWTTADNQSGLEMGDRENLYRLDIGDCVSTAVARLEKIERGWFGNKYYWKKVEDNPTVSRYVTFYAKQYHAKWPEVGFVLLDKQGKPVTADNQKGQNKVTVTLGVPTTTSELIPGSQERDITCYEYTWNGQQPNNTFTQYADNYGETGQATYTLSYSAIPDESSDYYFVGWATKEDGSDVSENAPEVTPITTAKIPEGDPQYNATPQALTKYYAVFRKKYSTTFTAPKVMLSENSSVQEATISVSPTTERKVDNNVESEVYTYTAVSTPYASFVGWSKSPTGSPIIDESVPNDYSSSTHTYTCTYQATFVDGNTDPVFEIPTLYAVYESFYFKPILKYSTKNSSKNYGMLSVSNGTRPSDDSGDWKAESIDGQVIVQVATLGQSSRTLTVSYHAKANNGAAFLAFTADEAGETTITGTTNDPNYSNANITVNCKAQGDAPSLIPVYVVFQENNYYYYSGAVAGFTDNGEKGKIIVTGKYYNEHKEGETLKDFSAETDDKLIDDSENVYNTALNDGTYSYTYTAEVTNPKTTFVGWSKSVWAEDIYRPDAEITETYTTISTDPDAPSNTAPLYAVFHSFWYQDPTVLLTTSSAGAGQVTALTEEKDPETITTWYDKLEGYDAEGKMKLTQAPTNHQPSLTYDMYYYAKPKFGANFAGWASTDNPNYIIADYTNNPYKVSYTVTSTDDEQPFVPARVYAVFKSVIEIIQQDRMIYYVDENGRENINDANIIINFSESETLHAELIGANKSLFELSDKQKVQVGDAIDLDATEGIIQLVLSYKGSTPKNHVGQIAMIELSSTYNDGTTTGTAKVTVEIKIEEKPTVTFLPIDGKGEYTIKHTDGRGVEYTMTKTATSNIYVPIMQENMSTFELHLTEDLEDDGVTFAGWEMIDDNGVHTYFSYDTICTYSFKESVYVRPVFLADNRAVFTILNDAYDKKYYDLQEAIDDAEKRYKESNNTMQVVVFSNEGRVDGVLQQGNYTIKKGVLLLIPGVGPQTIQVKDRNGKLVDDPFRMIAADDLDEYGNNKYVYRIKREGLIPHTSQKTDVVLSNDDYTIPSNAALSSYNAPTPACYRELIIEDNTSIIVEAGASLELYSVLGNGYLTEAIPYRYGRITMGENCNITLNAGENGDLASLFAFGYITGPQSSRVVANSGSEVYEIFQYGDTRGGKGVAHLYMFREEYKVFPFSQYFIQNVEIPLELKTGASEFVTTTAYVMENKYTLMSQLVTTTTSNGIGLFQLGGNASIVKYYDPVTDRLKVHFIGDASSSASLGYIQIKMGDLYNGTLKPLLDEALGGLSGLGNLAMQIFMNELVKDLKNMVLDSRDFVMPINNNVDVTVSGGTTLTLAQEFAMLAGSSLTVEEGSTLQLSSTTWKDKNNESRTSNGKLIVYDANENLLPAAMRTNPSSGAAVTDYASHSGYFSSSNEPLRVLLYTPNNSHQRYNSSTRKYENKRMAKDVKDAKLVIDGTVQINNGAGVYTTEGNAQIISNINGKIIFTSLISSTTTNQAKYITSGTTELLSEEGTHNKAIYNIHSAALQHANGTYLQTKSASSADTYTYYPAEGKWMGSKSSSTQTISGSTIRITMPDADISTESIDPITSVVTSSFSTAMSGEVTGENLTKAGFTSDANGAHTTIAYTPRNIAGEYEGLLTLRDDKSTLATQKLTIVEDYTPQFSICAAETPIKTYTTQAYVGHSSVSNAATLNIKAEANNVASILAGKFASSVVWDYDITGENADEFSFAWGTDANKLNAAQLTFTPKNTGSKNAQLTITCTYTDAADVEHATTMAISLVATGQLLTTNTLAFDPNIASIFVSSEDNFLFADETRNNKNDIILTYDESILTHETIEGEYAITPKSNSAGKTVLVTATQEPDLQKGIAGTQISQLITITEDVVWNWEHLYFGSENLNPVTVWENVTIESIEIQAKHTYTNEDNTTEVATGDRHNVVQSFEKSNGANYKNKISIAGWAEGETEVWFDVKYNVNGGNTQTKSCKSEVYRDPRELTVYVNDRRIHEAITWANIGIEYQSANQRVLFTSQPNQISQWTVKFIGIPDMLSFNAQGDNPWQIEESDNGNNWTIAYSWATIDPTKTFELSLQPSTRFIRISYGANTNQVTNGALTDVTISKLSTIKADVDKLYMPDPSATKKVVFTYADKDGFALSTSNDEKFSTSETKLEGLEEDPYYQIKRVTVSSQNTNDETGWVQADGTETLIPIRTFPYPQAIPIQLASDYEERYYFVASESYRTTWQKDTRKVIMQSVVADADPYVIFHFAEAPVPGIISFNFSPTAKGTWRIEESNDAKEWSKLDAHEEENLRNYSLMKKFVHSTTSRYVKVTYESDYAEIVELSNLAILPTTSTTVNPSELLVMDTKNEPLTIIASNLKDIAFTFTNDKGEVINDFAVTKGEAVGAAEYTSDELIGIFAPTSSGSVTQKVYIQYKGNALATYGDLVISTMYDANGNEKYTVLSTVKLTGIKQKLPIGNTSIKTGTSLQINGFANKNEGDEAFLRDVNTTHTFHIVKDANGNITTATPLFDYVIIYGETKTSDGDNIITTPTSTTGSNAQTPCYIYQKSSDGKYYEMKNTELHFVENANSSEKSWRGAISVPGTGQLKVYFTGFCPYASTGYSKSDEGAWYFEGKANDQIDIYLQDCYIYSRYKTKKGNSFSRSTGESYSDAVVRGSGAVLVFANNTSSGSANEPLRVNIHTRDNNLLKSHYGCLFESLVGRAFQVSAPIQLYMKSEDHFESTYTTLTFDDKWPIGTEMTDGTYTNTERTNGFLRLLKQVNNAPSIDIGNANSEVNFKGGQIQLQNAANSSDNYESTLAISYRTGMYGPAKFRFKLSRGIGTDGVGGRVNFYDGTTTVISMTVDPRYQGYYLMDTDANGNTLNTTSCLRTPKKTFVYGGSHCMMRACPDPKDSGGAPTDGDVEITTNDQGQPVETITGTILAPFSYKEAMGWNPNGNYGLVTPTAFPGDIINDITNERLADYYENANKTYLLESVTPVDGSLNLWIPNGYGGVKAEVNVKITQWKACMTYIEAKYGVYEGSIGGTTEVQFTDDVQSEKINNMLYCVIDQNISNVIRSDGYKATVLNPAPQSGSDDNYEKYIEIPDISVGEEYENYIINKQNYKVEKQVYYIIPARADIWLNFTAPFNVKNVYVMETYDEAELEKIAANNGVSAALLEQAKHNADFAAFYGVALALESAKNFNGIFADYMSWAKMRDGYTSGEYTKRGKYQLQHYYRIENAETGKLEFTNWNEASYFLYKNGENAWTLTQDGEFEKYTVDWEFVIPKKDEPLMKKGETYSMLFPYSTGNWDENNARDFWDYWTGKFLIFESTEEENGHEILGSNSVGATYDVNAKGWIYNNDFLKDKETNIYGNATFGMMGLKHPKVYVYYEPLSGEGNTEGFVPSDEEKFEEIKPTKTFLFAKEVPALTKRIHRDGTIVAGDDSNNGNQNGTTGNMPTVGGGNDMFITAIDGGINIAVAAPQHVRVLSSTGSVIFAGTITTATDVLLPTSGIYIISGENEVQKILH